MYPNRLSAASQGLIEQRTAQMFAGNWLGERRRGWQHRQAHQPLTKGRRRKDLQRSRTRSLHVEELEDRRMLAVYVVNTNLDTNPDGSVVVGSLRQAIGLSNGSNEVDQIVFADYLFKDSVSGLATPQLITLTGGQLTISDDVQILGPGSSALTISGGPGINRIFNVDDGSDDNTIGVTIGGMTLTGGNLPLANDASRGGAIRNAEALTVIESIVQGNSAARGGGGIFVASGSLTVERSLVQGNTSGGGGGGILNGIEDSDPAPSTTIINSTITGNSTFGAPMLPGFGGGVFNRAGFVYIQQSTITANSSTAGGGGVATYGVDPEDMNPTPIVTSLTHTIAYNNAGDDLFAVFVNIDGDLIRPDLRILDHNIVGVIGGSVLSDPAAGGNGHFYQVVSAPDGIDWATANAIASNPTGGAHLATPSSAQENTEIFNLVNDPQYWKAFTPPDESAAGMAGTVYDIGPWIGGIQTDTNPMLEPAMGWEWVTAIDFPDFLQDEDFTLYDNWAATQPDNGLFDIDLMNPPDPLPQEDRVAFLNDLGPAPADTWGDLAAEPEDEQLPIAFVIEYDQGTNMFGVDPLLMPLGDYGGATPVYYPTNTPALGVVSPAIDAGDSFIGGGFDQRGRHFARVAGFAIDIGAVETQQGIFRVDTLVDESDFQYSRVWELVNSAPFVIGYENLGTTGGDFSLREAIEFSSKNPEIDTITFEPLQDPTILLDLEDPTLGSPAPTILLSLRSDATSALSISDTVNILGPEGFELELDATGNDPTPGINNFDGSRVFSIDDGNLLNQIDVLISNLTLLGGDVVNSGGGIRNLENLTLRNSTVKQNVASNDGGGIFNQLGNLVIDSSTFNDNIASDDGGALFVDTAVPGNVLTVNVRNSTISGNTSGDKGGGIYNANGEVLVEFSTITLNVASASRGAGIASLPGIDALTKVRSSIVSNNLGEDIEFLSGATNIQSLGYNLIGDGNAAVVFNQPGDTYGVLDPMLTPLTNTGGPTLTHQPLLGSPVIDAGDPLASAGAGVVPLNDQRGSLFTRVYDGLQDTKARIDIGAYEYQPSVFTVDSLVDENDGDTSAGNFSLREAIEASNANPLADTIMFSPFLLGGTIFQFPANVGILHPGTPTDMRITDSVNIVGLGQSFLTLDGSLAFVDGQGLIPGRTRFFTIDDGNAANDIQVTISDLTLQNSSGTTDVGGSIKSLEDLTLERVTLVNNSTFGDGVTYGSASYSGGALYQRYGELTLDNVTITANRTNAVGADGGAVFVRDADLSVLNNSSISGNSTTQSLGSGGGIYIRNGVLNLSDASITNNLAPSGDANGSGLYGVEATLNIVDSTITGNTMSGSNSEGAGIFSKQSALNLTNSLVRLNKTTGTQSEGAGLYLNGGTAQIENSTIEFNSTTGTSSEGAGIAIVNGAEVSINHSTIDSNTTTGIGASGGGIHNLSGSLSILNSTISNNTISGSGAKGGGIYSDTNLTGAQTSSIVNSTVSGNSATSLTSRGGGVYNADGMMEISYSTITNNSVPYFGDGGGVASFGNSSTTQTRVRSSIIAGNFSTNDPVNPKSDVENVVGNSTNSFVSLGYNLIGKGLAPAVNTFVQTGDTNNVVDPGLAALADNNVLPDGTHTDIHTETHALLLTSPALNTGDPNAAANVGNVPEFDQRGPGFSRVVNGNIDIGAFESDLVPFDPSDFNEDGEVSGDDFLAWQRGFGKTNATKADGDSDGDGDVDSTDLGNWEAAYGGTQVIAAVQSEPPAELEPLAVESDGASILAVMSESAPQSDSSVAGEITDPQPVSANPALGNTVMVVGLTSASPDLSPPEAVVSEEGETAAIDESLAELGETDRRTAGLDGESDYVYLALSRQSQDEDAAVEADFEAEDSVFAMLAEGVF